MHKPSLTSYRVHPLRRSTTQRIVQKLLRAIPRPMRVHGPRIYSRAVTEAYRRAVEG